MSRPYNNINIPGIFSIEGTQPDAYNEPAYDAVALRLISLILDERIITTQYSHIKEEQRLMRARVK